MFNFSFDNRMLYVILALLVVSSFLTMSQGEMLSILLTLPGVIVAISFHEFAHAYAADKLGDDTPRMQGRLNLNPLSHLDPIGIILLIFVHIGWGKPVQINPRNFDRKYTMDQGEAIVSLAGPVINFILAIVLSVIYFAIAKFAPVTFVLSQTGEIISTIISSAVIVNIGLGVFNLIPLPPLDGSKIFRNILPYNAKAWIDRNERWFYIIFLVIWITGLAGIIISPIIDGIAEGIFLIMRKIFGL